MKTCSNRTVSNWLVGSTPAHSLELTVMVQAEHIRIQGKIPSESSRCVFKTNHSLQCTEPAGGLVNPQDRTTQEFQFSIWLVTGWNHYAVLFSLKHGGGRLCLCHRNCRQNGTSHLFSHTLLNCTLFPVIQRGYLLRGDLTAPHLRRETSKPSC